MQIIPPSIKFPSNWSASALVGLMMSVLSISYLAFAPIWGFFMDRYLFAKTTSVMLIGGLFIAASDLLMGPAPFLGLKK
jgi:MFS family permease